MAVPTYDQLMLPLMKLLAEQKAPIKVSEVVELLAECSKLSNDELEQKLPSGKNIFKDRVAWAKTYLVKAGLVQQPKRAFCEISELGRSINLNGLNSITNDFLSQFDSFRDYKFSRSNKFETENSLIVDREININEISKNSYS